MSSTAPLISRLRADIAKARRLTKEVEALALRAFDRNFELQGFFQRGQWPQSGRVKKLGGSTLVHTGRLRNDITARSTIGRVEVYLLGAAPYGHAHNSGFSGSVTQQVDAHRVRAHKRRNKWGKMEKVKAHTRSAHSRTATLNLPKRQFIGSHPVLMRAIDMRIRKLMQL